MDAILQRAQQGIGTGSFGAAITKPVQAPAPRAPQTLPPRSMPTPPPIQMPDIKFQPQQIIDLYKFAESQGRASGNEEIFQSAYDKSLSDYGLTSTNLGDTSTKNTGIVINFPPPAEYSRVAKPLSADMIQAFGQRRLVADQAYQNALAQEEAGIGRFRASFEAAKQRLDNEYNRASDRLARQLAGRGVARSPMVRGRREREMGQVVDEQLGEMKLNLSTEIEALKQASEMARIERLSLMAQLEQEEALARSQSFDYIRSN